MRCKTMRDGALQVGRGPVNLASANLTPPAGFPLRIRTVGSARTYAWAHHQRDFTLRNKLPASDRSIERSMWLHAAHAWHNSTAFALWPISYVSCEILENVVKWIERIHLSYGFEYDLFSSLLPSYCNVVQSFCVKFMRIFACQGTDLPMKLMRQIITHP